MATQADLDKLESAYYSGIRRVEFSDRVVEYASRREMERAIDRLRAELGLARPDGRKGKAVTFITKKGLD